MDWLGEFIRSGRAIDAILIVLLAEAAVLLLRRRARPLAILLALAPGALILLAARAALTGEHWALVAAPLLLSFPLHLADLGRRGW